MRQWLQKNSILWPRVPAQRLAKSREGAEEKQKKERLKEEVKKIITRGRGETPA